MGASVGPLAATRCNVSVDKAASIRGGEITTKAQRHNGNTKEERKGRIRRIDANLLQQADDRIKPTARAVGEVAKDLATKRRPAL
jgi:hypothetical protein